MAYEEFGAITFEVILSDFTKLSDEWKNDFSVIEKQWIKEEPAVELY